MVVTGRGQAPCVRAHQGPGPRGRLFKVGGLALERSGLLTEGRPGWYKHGTRHEFTISVDASTAFGQASRTLRRLFLSPLTGGLVRHVPDRRRGAIHPRCDRNQRGRLQIVQ